ncbi:MAG: hypothetical protein LBJ67_14295 [Planctomycetaceae bacterium]|jgi:hypothetical protein|nr:hypothetical protein [Planctomycetaceae bacterium]
MIEIISYPMPDYQVGDSRKYVQYKMLTMSFNDIDEAIEIVKQNEIDIIRISPHHGFTRGNLDFILSMKNLFGIDIFDSKNIDISAIERCDHLKFVRIAQTPQPVNLSHLSGLVHLVVSWHHHMILPLPQKCNLKSLFISGYNYKTLESIPFYNSLIALSMNFGSVTSLTGLERFQSLKLYHHSYGKNLCDIRQLTKLPLLKDIELDHCKKIQIEGILEQCRKLKILKYFSCPNLPSLSFLHKLKDIEFFSFSNIDVKDGDMTPLLKLKYFGFYPNKKHFSHTLEEIRKIQQKNDLSTTSTNDTNSGFYTITFDNGMEYHEEGCKSKINTFVKKIENEFQTKCARLQWSATTPSSDSS